MKNRMLLTVALTLFSHASLAQDDWSFSLASGLPFFVTPEVSYQPAESEFRYYASFKGGLDNGGTIGFETAFSDNKKHAYGAFIGSVGVRDGEDDCDPDEVNPFATIFCALGDAFDWERVDGVGVSYSYHFNEFGQAGWFTRLEAGYGKGSESERNLASGSISFGYRF